MSRILLVDDDDAFRSLVRVALEQMGHEVREAIDGDEALRSAAAEPPEVMLIDLIMPRREGLETITALRGRQPELRIIAMSGGSRDGKVDYLKVAKRMGAHRTLTKPFAPEVLAQAIAELPK